MTNIVQCWMHDILFFYFGFRYLQSRGSLICSYALNPLTDLAKKRPSLCQRHLPTLQLLRCVVCKPICHMIILSEATHLIQIFQCRHHPIPGLLTCSFSLKPLTSHDLSCLKHVCNYPLFHLNLFVYWLCIISNEETSEKDPQNEITRVNGISCLTIYASDMQFSYYFLS